MYVKDFVLMDEVHLSFDANMSAFTGETGAGKSLLMDAIALLKGERINTSMIKEGKEKSIIEGVFEVQETHRANQLLKDAGIALEDGMLVASREISKEGKSIARMNQRVVNVSFLKEVISSLVDIHSQHDTQYLLNAKYHVSLLDRFCDVEELRLQTASSYHAYKTMKDELEAALREDYNEADLDFLTHQLNEIDEAAIAEDELLSLEEEQKRLMAFEKITQKANAALELLDDDQKGSNVIYNAYREVSLIHEDVFFEQVSEKLQDAYYMIDEQVTAIKDHMEHFDYDEDMFHQQQERIFLIHKILRKYGPSFREVNMKRDDFERKIDIILHRQDYIVNQEKQRDLAYSKYLQDAQQLHKKREKKSIELERLVMKQLHDLQLPHAVFHVQMETFEGNANGIDQVSFLISMNQGEPLKPLSTTASGGELSRFMLGLKTVFTSLQGIETIIFDEIDTGVSGSVAFRVGCKMKEIAQDIQVFCVTHLASVAACAHHHYIVEKTQDNSSTTTNIHLLDETQRIQQLALISNNSTSDSALKAAKELRYKGQQQ